LKVPVWLHSVLHHPIAGWKESYVSDFAGFNCLNLHFFAIRLKTKKVKKVIVMSLPIQLLSLFLHHYHYV